MSVDPDFIKKAAEKASDLPAWMRHAGFRAFYCDSHGRAEEPPAGDSGESERPPEPSPDDGDAI